MRADCCAFVAKTYEDNQIALKNRATRRSEIATVDPYSNFAYILRRFECNMSFRSDKSGASADKEEILKKRSGGFAARRLQFKWVINTLRAPRLLQIQLLRFVEIYQAAASCCTTYI